MKLSEIKIGDHIPFKTEGLMSYIYNGEGACTLSGNHVHPIQDIVTIKGEQYLKFWDCMHLKVSELYEKGILIREHTFSPGDEVEPVDLSGDLQIYDIVDRKFGKSHITSPHAYVNFQIKAVQGDYIQEQVHDHIWFKASDFKKKETMITKPYNDVKEVTYYMITTHPYFQRLSEKELARIIKFMDYNGFTKLDGEDGWEKAKILRESFQTKEAPEKDSKKEKFTVEGSTRLRKALADELKEEADFQVCAAIGLQGVSYNEYLTPGADKVVGVTNDKATIHYILPGDWDKSIEAFKNYFTPEYKAGDIVVVDGSSYNNEKDFIAELSVVEINDYWVNNPGGLDSNYGREYDKSGSYKRLCVDKLIKRLATEEEIEQYKASKEKITVAGYEMKVKKTLASNGVTDENKAKFCDQHFTIQELESYKKLLQLQKYIYVNIRLGDTTLDLETLDKIISKLK